MEEKQRIYDELSKVIMDFETGMADAQDLYAMLCDIQNNWEDVITVSGQ